MKKLTLLILTVLAMTACGHNDKPAIRVGRGTPGNPANPVSPNVTAIPPTVANGTAGQWGTITGYTDQQVQDFVNDGGNQTPVGTVATPGCQTKDGYPCQIDFNVSMNQSSSFTPLQLSYANNSQSQFIATGGGVLTIAIYDNKTQSNVMTAIAAVMGLSQATMNYNSNTGVGNATLQFQDSYGNVVMQGNIQGENFTGSVTFSTPSNGSESLGSFATNICYVFQCSSF